MVVLESTFAAELPPMPSCANELPRSVVGSGSPPPHDELPRGTASASSYTRSSRPWPRGAVARAAGELLHQAMRPGRREHLGM
jgi:hypothetical protein